MSFNTIARKKNGDVIGKLSLSTLKNLQASWDIIYCESFIPKDTEALFRFRKMGGHFEVQSTVLESLGGIDEYAMFNSEAPDGEYDWIEVKTVKHCRCMFV
ncbi:unnamed protein product [Orchesella dallaii]|uniref:Uncharacterized protein n=1 Tax=Orchesella dallaii TaxID=48710 RepID=A0ABP1S422_9HEXA